MRLRYARISPPEHVAIQWEAFLSSFSPALQKTKIAKAWWYCMSRVIVGLDGETPPSSQGGGGKKIIENFRNSSLKAMDLYIGAYEASKREKILTASLTM